MAAIVTTVAKTGRFDFLPPLTAPEVFGTFIAAAIGSALPDIDQPSSKIGHKLPIMARLMKGMFGHRGLCHSLLFLAVLYAATLIFLPSMQFYSLIMCLGAGSHLIFDMFNCGGVPLVWPFRVRFRVARIKTESPRGNKKDNAPEQRFRAVVRAVDVFLLIIMAGTLLGLGPLSQ